MCISTRSHFRLHSDAFAIVLGFAGLLSSRSARAAEPIDEVSATRVVCTKGPDRAVAHATRQSGAAAVTAAHVLPNPSLVGSYQSTFSGVTDRELIVGVSVPVGISGRRFVLQDAADERLKQAEAQGDATVFESAIAFREAYADAVIDQARVQVRTEQQKALDELSETIAGLQKGGEASAYDLLRQSVQARLHRRTLESTKADALASRALLEAWLGREVTLPSTAPQALVGPVQRSTEAVPTTPRIRALDAQSRASELEARAAHRQWVPDLDVFAGYRAVGLGDQTGHGMSLGLTVPLTFFDHGQGDAARADAEQEVARAAAERLRRQQQAQLKGARLRLQLLEASAADAQAASVEAQAVRDKARQLYAAGEAAITELLEAYRGAEDARLAELDLALEIALTRLAVMKEAGTMFNVTLDHECGGTGGAR